MPSYHDLHITTKDILRTSIFNLPYGLEVMCRPGPRSEDGGSRVAVTVNRVAGWELWRTDPDIRKWELLAGEYDGPDKWLILDVAGFEIVNSRDREPE